MNSATNLRGIALAGLAGLLLGGLTVGIADVYRATPLFSFADGGGYALPSLPECSAPYQHVGDFLRLVDAEPRPIPPQAWADYEDQFHTIASNLYNCVQSACAARYAPVQAAFQSLDLALDRMIAIEDRLEDARIEADTFESETLGPAEAAYEEAADAYTSYAASLPLDPSAEQLAMLAQLESAAEQLRDIFEAHAATHQALLAVIDDLEQDYDEAEDEAEYWQIEWNVRQQAYEESNCEDYLEEDIPELGDLIENEDPGTGGSDYRPAPKPDATIRETVGAPVPSKY